MSQVRGGHFEHWNHLVWLVWSSPPKIEKNCHKMTKKVNHGEHENIVIIAWFIDFSLLTFESNVRHIFSTQTTLYAFHQRESWDLSLKISFPHHHRKTDGEFFTPHKWLRAMPRSCGIIDVQHFTLITGISGMLWCRIFIGRARVQWNFRSLHRPRLCHIYHNPTCDLSNKSRDTEMENEESDSEGMNEKKFPIARGRRANKSAGRGGRIMPNTLGEKLCVLCWRIFFLFEKS